MMRVGGMRAEGGISPNVDGNGLRWPRQQVSDGGLDNDLHISSRPILGGGAKGFLKILRVRHELPGRLSPVGFDSGDYDNELARS